MPREENNIDKQKFTGVMDSGSDVTAVKKGNHRASYGFRNISANDDTFTFQTIKGTENQSSIRPGYKICCWESYENSIYVLSKKFEQPVEFSYAESNSGKIQLIFAGIDINDFLSSGDWVYAEWNVENPYSHIEQSGAFQILSIVDTTTIELDLDAALFYEENLGVGTSGGLIELLNGGEIGELIVDPSNGDTTYKALYWHKDLLFSFRRYGSKESSHINKENAKILRWYFTDYLTGPKVFNLRADRYRTIIAADGIEDGKSYMVTDGTITYNSVAYGVDETALNVFSVTTGNGLTYTGTGRVIEYYPVELLEWSPDYNQGDIQYIQERVGGQIPVATYSAVYRCYDDEGAVTPWSMPTQPIYLGKGTSENTLSNYHEIQGSFSNENSGKQLEFILTNIDQRWTKIQVAVVKHVSKLISNNPLVFYDEKIESDRFEVVYDGTNSEYSFNLADLTTFNRYFKKVMSIESMQEIGFAGNFESGSLLTSYSPTTPAFSYVIKSLVSDEVQSNEEVSANGDHIWNTASPYGINGAYPVPLVGHDAKSTKGLYSGTYYEIKTAVSADIGDGSPVTYFRYEIFTVDDSQSQEDFDGSGLNATPVILIKNHQDITGIDSTSDMVIGEVYTVVGADLSDYVVGRMFEYVGQALTFGAGTVTLTGYKKYSNEGYLDGNGSLTQNKLTTYPRNEKIRVGIVPVDLKGNKLPVRWLGDYTTPSIPTEPLCSSEIKTSRGDRYVASLNHLGLKIGSQASPVDVSDIIDQISGFHIVVAPILRNTKVQGLMFQTQRQQKDPVRVGPEFGTYLDFDGYRDFYVGDEAFPTTYVHGWPRNKVLFGPDVMFNTQEDLGINNSDLLKIEGYLDDEQYELFETAFGTWTKIKGNYFESESASSLIDQKYSVFFKFQEFISDQTTDKNNPGDTVNIEGVKKYQFETSGEIPGLIDIVYRTSSVSEVDAPAGSTGGRHSSYIYNHLLITHEFQDTFGLELTNQRHGVLASIVSPGEVSYDSIENTQYVATGHFQPMTAQIKTLTAGLFYDIEIFGGQSFLSYYTQLRNTPRPFIGFVFNTENETYPGLGLSITFPCESKVNPYRRIFEHIARDREELTSVGQPESFEIDEATKYDGSLIKFTALQEVNYENTLFEKSIAYSLTKIQGEKFDKFRQFPFANIRTTEGDMERIMAIKQSDQFLIVWHEKGVSYYPISDRAAISDNQGASIRIGYGGIMDVNLPLSFIHGLQDRLALVETDNAFVWVSKRNKQIVMMKKGSKPVPFGDENILEASIDQMMPRDSGIYLIDDPYFTFGISGTYDRFHKEILFSFINKSRSGRVNIFNDKNNVRTLVIDANHMKPTGYFPFVADLFINFDRFVYSSIPVSRQAIVDEAVSLDEIVYNGSSIYIALVNTTVPSDLADLATDATFLEIGTFEQIFIHYEGTDMEFYNVPMEPEFQAVFNQPVEFFKRFDAHQLRVDKAPSSVQWETDVNDSLAEIGDFDSRDYSKISSLSFDRTGGRARGNGILIIYKWAKSAGKVTLRQIDLFFKFINQK
jgi:hypothetical protein